MTRQDQEGYVPGTDQEPGAPSIPPFHPSRNPARRPIWYRLDGHTPVPCTGPEWAMFMEETWEGNGRVVGQDHYLQHDGQRVLVSTVFLGVDTALYDDAPLFETMVLGGLYDHHQEKSATWEEAEETHERVRAIAAEHAVPLDSVALAALEAGDQERR